MNVYMHAHIPICVCIYCSMRIYINSKCTHQLASFLCVHICLFVCTCAFVCVYVRVGEGRGGKGFGAKDGKEFLCESECARARVCVCVRVCACVCAYIYNHPHTHTHIHTRIYTHTSAEMLLFLEYQVPGPLTKSFVQTLKTKGDVGWRWVIWVKLTKFIVIEDSTKFCGTIYSYQELFVMFIVYRPFKHT